MVINWENKSDTMFIIKILIFRRGFIVFFNQILWKLCANFDRFFCFIHVTSCNLHESCFKRKFLTENNLISNPILTEKANFYSNFENWD